MDVVRPKDFATLHVGKAGAKAVDEHAIAQRGNAHAAEELAIDVALQHRVGGREIGGVRRHWLDHP